MATTFTTVVALLPFLAAVCYGSTWSGSGIGHLGGTGWIGGILGIIGSALRPLGSNKPSKLPSNWPPTHSLGGGTVPLSRFAINPVWIVDKSFSDMFGPDYDSDWSKVEVLRKKAEELMSQNTTGNKKVVALLQPGKIVRAEDFDHPVPLKHWLGMLCGKAIAAYPPNVTTCFVLTGTKTQPNTPKYYVYKTACADKNQNVVMMHYVDDDVTTAKNMVQAIGRFLGIGLDYKSDGAYRSPRGYASLCTDGFMGHFPYGAKWTQCSRDDFIDLYKEKKLDCLDTRTT